MDDNTPFTAANVWDPNTLNLKEVPSLSYGTSPANMVIDDASNRIMKIELSTGLGFLKYVAVGEYLSWHYGWTASTMVSFREDTDLTIDNIRIFNALRSALFIAYATNVTVKNVTIKPEGNQLAMGPRDGIHSSRIKGDYLVDNLTVEGSRLDAFVARGTFSDVYEIIGTKSLKIRTDSPLTSTYTYDTSLPLEFIDENGDRTSVEVNTANYVQTVTDPSGYLYEIETKTDIPSFVEVNTEVIARGLSVRSLTLKNNHYKNIAGSSEILYVDNVISTNNTHFKIMHPAVRFGANSKAGHVGSNYQVTNSVFTDCAWENNSTHLGYISTRNNHLIYAETYNYNLLIKGNTFTSTSSETNEAAVHLLDIDKVTIADNSFCGFNEPVRYFSTRTRNIDQFNNTYCSCNAIKKEVFSTTKDAFVKGGDFESTNYGSFKTIEVKNSSNPQYKENIVPPIRFN